MVYSLMKEEALSLVNRIGAAQTLCNTIFPIMGSHDINTHSPLQPLIEEFNAIIEHIEDFNHNFGNILPASLTVQLSEILKGNTAKKIYPIKNYFPATHPLSALVHCLGRLNMLANAIKYELNSSQNLMQRNIENAFNHLKYTLVVDDFIRAKWNDIWVRHAKGEISKPEIPFEDLGRVHFLSHSIWSFSANSRKQRTDSIYVQLEKNSTQNADALVQSEWKTVNSEKDLAQKIKEAMVQSWDYDQGILYANQLSTYRYLVMVSKDHLNIDPEIIKDKNGNLYRIVNIATAPSSPSNHARNKKKRSPQIN